MVNSSFKSRTDFQFEQKKRLFSEISNCPTIPNNSIVLLQNKQLSNDSVLLMAYITCIKLQLLAKIDVIVRVDITTSHQTIW